MTSTKRHALPLTLCATLLLAAASLNAQTPAAQIARLNQTLATAQTVTPQLAALLTQRATLLGQLIAADPAQALQQALAPDVADRLRATAPPNSLETRGDFEGRLEDTIADDFVNHRSQTRHYLRTSTGPIEVFFTAQPPHTGALVRIHGLRLADRMAVETVTPAVPQTTIANTVAQAACTTLGPQNIAVIMLTMPSNRTFPDGYTTASLQDAFFGSPSDTSNAQSLNGFWKEASYGQTSATGQVFGPFALQNDYTYDTQGGLATEAVSLSDSTVDFTQFTHVALVFPIANWGGFGGDDDIGCATLSSPSKGNVQLSVGWFPAFPNASPDVETFAHELGHGLGLNHSSTDDYGAIPLGQPDASGSLVEYGDPFAAMASTLGHYAPEHKSILRWLKPGTDYLEVTAPGTFGLLPYETTANPRALRVLRDPYTSAWLWLEYRQPLGDIDKNIQQSGGNVFSGALVRYEDPTLDDLHTYLLDFNPVATPNNFQTAALTPGTTWSDPNSLLTLSTNSATASGLNVVVGYDTPCATLQYSATTFPATGGSGSVTVSAPSDCNWKAASSTTWLTISSGTSGSGNGTVQFSLTPNSATTQQTATISVQRQSTRIIELGTVNSVLSVTPVLGNGDTGQFTFEFDEASGFQNITYSDIYFGGANGCHAQVLPAYHYLYLSADGGAFAGPLNLNTPGGTVSTSLCSISVTGSSTSGSGTRLQITLQVNFTAAFAGAHRISAVVSDGVTFGSELALGTWTVPAVQQPGITITSNVPGAPFSLDGGSVYQAPATFYWTAGSQHTIAWLSTTASQPGARYVFQNWADGGANPRTITVPATTTTYTAALQAQYQLTLAASPANAGGIIPTPASPDGYYNAGAPVSLSAVPAPGYYFWYFGGDASGSTSPQSVTMSAPLSVTANFYCSLQFSAEFPSQISAGANQGILQWTMGNGCAWSVSSDSSWFTLTGATTGTGNGFVSWSAVPNTGASRNANVTFTGALTATIALTQKTSTSLSLSIASVAPVVASGLNQTFTLQFYDPSGAQFIDSFFVYFDPAPTDSSCDFYFSKVSGQWDVFLPGSGSGNLPLASAVSNGTCTLSGSTFSVNGNSATATFTLAFAASHPGARYLNTEVSDSQNSQASSYTTVALFTVTPVPNTITFPPLPDIPSTTTSVTLAATASSGDPITYTSNTPAVCTITNSTATILIAGGCSITATQPGDATYAAATPVTQKFTVTFADVDPGDIFYNEISAFAQHGITSGCGNNGFCPAANVTRNEMAIFIVRAIYGNDNFTYTTTPYFTDVTPSTFGFQWIQKLKDLGITSGCTATTYCPEEVVTRDQMAIFIIRARLGLNIAGPAPTFTYPATPYFTDATAANEFAFPWIQRMKLENITSGCTTTTYCSTDPVTREEMATFIMRGAFNQFLPAGTPILTQISPSTLPLGTSATYTVTGTNTSFLQGVTQLSPIPGVTIGAVTVTSPTTLTVQLTASGTAIAQPYSILAITGTEEDVLPNGLILQ